MPKNVIFFWKDVLGLSDMLNYVTLVRQLDILYYAINAEVSMKRNLLNKQKSLKYMMCSYM